MTQTWIASDGNGRNEVLTNELLDGSRRAVEAVAICGSPACPSDLIEGEQARNAVKQSY